MEDLTVVIQKEHLDQCRDFCTGILSKKSEFEEMGGATIGMFDGRHFFLDSFIHDSMARADPATIYFSTDVFEEARRTAASKNLRVMGTWHVHPPGFGAGFSQTDGPRSSPACFSSSPSSER